MKRLILTLASLAAIGLSMALPSTVFAAASSFGSPLDAACGQNANASSSAACAGKDNKTNPLTGSDGTIHKVTLIIGRVTSVVAVIMMAVGGLMYVVSGGDSGKTKSARDTIIYAAIGLVVILLAQAIIILVIDRI